MAEKVKVISNQCKEYFAEEVEDVLAEIAALTEQWQIVYSTNSATKVGGSAYEFQTTEYTAIIHYSVEEEGGSYPC